MRKGQVSMELLAIIGFVIVLFIPLVLFMYFKTGELDSGMEGLQSRLISSKLASMADSLGSMGDGSAMKIEFALPEAVKTLRFSPLGAGGEVMLTMSDGSQISEVTRFPFTPASYGGNANYQLEFSSENGTIRINERS